MALDEVLLSYSHLQSIKTKYAIGGKGGGGEKEKEGELLAASPASGSTEKNEVEKGRSESFFLPGSLRTGSGEKEEKRGKG